MGLRMSRGDHLIVVQRIKASVPSIAMPLPTPERTMGCESHNEMAEVIVERTQRAAH